MSRPAATMTFSTTMMSPAAEAAAPGIGARLLALVSLPASGPRDEREAYLAQAVDHRDLEQRFRAWDAHVERMKSLTFAG